MAVWVGRSAVEIAGAVRRGEVSPRQVVVEHLEHIEAVDPGIGAFREVLAAQALRDAEMLEGHSGISALPLAGVPVAVKDNLPVAGVSTRHGSAATADTPARADHETVRRLRAAGAVVVGVTAVPELCVFGTTDSVFGITRNPWDTSRSAGGSSGGSAAAVAAAMVPIALGNDGMGSIRIPAANCGVVGLKPGHGLVPGDLGSNGWFGMSENGPIAGCTADIQLMLFILAQTGAPALRPDRLPRLRIALSVHAPFPGIPVNGRFIAAVRDTGRTLKAAGHSTVRAEVPYPLWLGSAAMSRWMAGTAADAEALNARLLTRRTRTHATLGRGIAAAGLVRPAQRTRWQNRLENFFADHDVLITPALAQPAPPARAWHTKSWSANLLANMRHAPFSYPWNLAGWPALTLPAGTYHNGHQRLPLSVQLVTRLGGEEQLLHLARQLEQHRPWQRTPENQKPVTSRPETR